MKKHQIKNIVHVVVLVVVNNMGKVIHGLRHTRIYATYHHIIAKCYKKYDNHYKWYGARGIVVCQEWLDDFMNFYNWAMENGYQDNLTIDRIDVNGNYEPSNCRWVDQTTQVRNRRNTIKLTYKGETKPLAEWCEILNLNYNTIKRRLYRGWDVTRALEYVKK